MADYLGYERAFKAFNIPYYVENGAYERGHGDMVSFNFIVCHHTAGGNDAGDVRIVRDGRSDLPGPLSQLVLKRDGSVAIIAVGVSWHAGYGPAKWGAPAGQGNQYSVGIEGVSNGRNDWTPAQRASYPRVVAALLKDANLPVDRWIFHRDYNKVDGKIDPVGFEAAWFDAEVKRHYDGASVPQKTEIQKCRDANLWLGNKVTDGDEWDTGNKKGKYAFYENGGIYWSLATGAQALSMEMVRKWGDTGYESGWLGFPVTTVADTPDKTGRFAHFQNGSIYWTEKFGAFTVGGDIKKLWMGLNWEKSFLGYPKSEEIALPDKVGKLQDFENGIVYWSPQTGAQPIGGLILEAFRKNEYEKKTGYPKTGEIACPTAPGVFQIFEFAHAYYQAGAEKAFLVDNDVLEYYGRMGYESGRLGFPVTNKYDVGDQVYKQDFMGGSIQIDYKDKELVLILNGEVVKI